MARKDLSLKPKNLKVNNQTANAWFYEEGRGLEIIIEIPRNNKSGSWKEYHHVMITWATIMSSVRRWIKR